MFANATLHFGFITLIDLLKISAGVFAAGFLLHHFSAFLRRWISGVIGLNAFNLIFAVGIMIHEICHMIAATLFLHEIVDLKLFDWKAKDGSHGHVISRPRAIPSFFKIWIWLGELFIGIAPLILGPAISFLCFYFLVPGGKSFVQNPTWQFFPHLSGWMIFWIYLTIAIFSQMELSDADLKGTWKGYLWLVICTFSISLLYYKLKHI